MKESKIYQKVKKDLNKLKFYGIRIENSVDVGTPDSFWQSKQGNFWMELKQVNKKRITDGSEFSPDWREGQIAWAKRHIKFGGRWVLLIAINDELYFSTRPRERYKFCEMSRYYPSNLVLLSLYEGDK